MEIVHCALSSVGTFVSCLREGVTTDSYNGQVILNLGPMLQFWSLALSQTRPQGHRPVTHTHPGHPPTNQVNGTEARWISESQLVSGELMVGSKALAAVEFSVGRDGEEMPWDYWFVL